MALPFQPVPNTVEIAVQGTLNGQKVENTFYAQASSAITEAICSELAQIVADWVVSDFLPRMVNQYTHNRVVATDLSVEGGFQAINVEGGGSTGGGGASDQPNNSTLAIHRGTTRSGKYQKSRIYVSGIPTAVLTANNYVSSAYANSWITILDNLFTLIAAGVESDYKNGYAQRVLNGVRLATGNFIESVGWSVTDLVTDSMRRRLPGRGV